MQPHSEKLSSLLKDLSAFFHTYSIEFSDDALVNIAVEGLHLLLLSSPTDVNP